MSRSGIFAHFGSVENLRMAVLEHARTDFIESVFTPARTQAEGLPRLYATLRHWLDYLDARSDAGGCIFLSAIPQWTGAPGPARMRFIDIVLALRQELIENCAQAVRFGHLRSGIVVEELVAELHAILYGANWSRHALGDGESFELARRSVERCLRMVATPEGVRAAKTRRVAPAEIRPLSS